MKAVMHFDGACRGNPGMSAGAAIIRIIPDHKVRVFGKPFHGTNNEAEYHGLLSGLHEALYFGVTHLEIYGDSKLVVMQVQRQWKCKKPHLVALRDEARALLSNFTSWTISWVPREQNTEADAASNAAIDNPKAESE